MARLDFESLIHSDRYQVFLFACPAWVPVQFARHPWFVINKKGTCSRWEVSAIKNIAGTHWGYVCKDFLPLFKEILMFSFLNISWKNKTQLIGSIEGDENSVAAKMIECIERSGVTYPHAYIYRPWGPNSNTYVQWILDKFPEFSVKLSFRFIGKNYNKRQ